MIAALLLASGLLQNADALRAEAQRLVEAGSAAEAEAKAREAIARSAKFAPEEEIEVRPDRGLLFDEMILEARSKYRERRAQYFRILAEALEAQEKWAPSRKAYRRAFQITPSAEVPLRMAEHPDLSTAERVDLLLDGYLASAAGAARAAIESKLLGTGAFLSRNALKASLDRKRFPELRAAHPALQLVEGAFPDFQAAAEGGPLLPAQLFRAGAALVLYLPAEGCGRCSEELDGIAQPLAEARERQQPIEAAAFVPERELSTVRTVTRLLAIPVRVARRDALPPSLVPLEGGEIRIVSRGGLTSIRIPMSDAPASAQIRRMVEAIFAFLNEPGLPTEARPEQASERVIELPRGGADATAFRAWIDVLEKLEAGPAPLEELYAELARVAQRAFPEGPGGSGSEELLQGLADLSRLRGANAAKTRLLGLASDRIGERLLEHARGLDPSLRRSLSGEEGVFHLAVADSGEIYLQRSFASTEGRRDFDFVLAESNGALEIVWSAAQDRRSAGVEALARGGAFFFACEPDVPPCRGARLVHEGEQRFEGEPMAVVEGRLVRIEDAIVDEPPRNESAPVFYRPVATEEEGALARGLRSFEAGDYAAAEAAFREAEGEIDPIAPYDLSELTYNRARALEEQGKRREALALFRSLGDVSYQSLVDERARAIESGR